MTQVQRSLCEPGQSLAGATAMLSTDRFSNSAGQGDTPWTNETRATSTTLEGFTPTPGNMRISISAEPGRCPCPA